MAAQDTDLVDQLPLQGVVLCSTVTDDVLLKTKLAEAAGQMGAVHKLDLTSDVTHLIVANINTPKYRYVAKERPDIKVLSPDFIEAVRKAWTEGGDVDVEALEKEHTLPPFFGLHVCLTGIPDQPRRSNMEQAITSNGGNYHGDLTKVVTHLIVAKPEGAKYTFAKQWHIPVVSVKWFEDSLARGMALQEDLYAPELPLEQQGRNAFRKVAKRPSLGKRPRDGDQNAGGADASRRKLRKTASMRFDSQSQDMWQSISAQEVQVEATELDAWNDESQTLKASERPKSRDQSANSRPITPMEPAQADGIFSGYYILLHGFRDEQAKKLLHHLTPNGAVVVNSVEQLEEAAENLGFQVRCLMVPHEQPTVLPDVPPGTLLVSEWWVERCIMYKQQLDPAQDLLSSPLSNTVVSGFANLTITTAGFTDAVHHRQTMETIKLMGASHEAVLGASTNVFVSESANVKDVKAFYAWKHNIPIVSTKWLWDSFKARRRVSYDQYKIAMPSFDAKDVYGEPSANTTPAPSEERSQLPIRGSVENIKRAADLLPPKRLSNTRRRHATPSLPLQASKPPEHRKPRPGPFILEDDDNDDEPIVCDEPSAPVVDLPLKEISPNRSQPRSMKEADAHETKDDSAAKVVTEKPSASPRKQPASPRRSPMKETGEKKPKLREELTSDLASILARQVASRPESTGELQKRKHRPLGRNLSTISNHSGSASASPNLPSEIPESALAGDGFDGPKEASSLPPSTQLGYDTPEAEAHRRKLSKQMGMSFAEDGDLGRRICSVGTVKDSAEIASRTAATAAGRGKTRRGKA